jgi:predicted phage replisome organizer
MPDGDSILIIWIRLMTLAGKVNDEGFVYLNEHVPYTPEMLSVVFGRKISTVKLALTTFENLGMVEIVDNKILISNWTKHQSVEGLADIKRKEQARLRQAKHRLKQKQLVTHDVTLQSRDESRKVTSLELERELELEGELERDKKPSKPPKKKYADFVTMTEEEYEKLLADYGEAQAKDMIERLNEYKGSKGKKYKSDYLTCKSWFRKDGIKPNEKKKDWTYQGDIDLGDTDINDVPW